MIKSKKLAALLIILQIIFAIMFGTINLSYQSKILESAKYISNYLSEQKLDDISVFNSIIEQKNIFKEDPEIINQHYKDILRNFQRYLFLSFLVLVIFMSFFWSLSHKMINQDKFQKFKKCILKSLLILIFYLLLIFIFFYLIVNISLADSASKGIATFLKYVPFVIFSFALLYFMFVSLAIADKTSLNNIFESTIVIGIRKSHYIFLIYLISLVLFSVPMFLLYFFSDKSLIISFLSIFLFFFSLAYSRIFMINVVRNIKID